MKGNNIGPNLSKLGAAITLVALVLGFAVRSDGASVASAAPVTRTVLVGQVNGGTTSSNQYNSANVAAVQGDTIRFTRFAGTHNIASSVVPAGAVLSCSPVLGACSNTAWEFPPTATGGGDAIAAATNYDLAIGAASAVGTYTYYCTIHANASDASLANVDGNIAGGGKMVGKFVVSAPAADTTPPAASLVAASPNPTDGAGSVALTATVTDSGTPLGNIASARYRIDAGASVAMAAVDGSFNSSSEGVSANVPVGALSLGIHTVEVQGTDDAGLNSAWVALTGGLNVTAPPAGAIQATVSVNAGNLTNTAQNVAFPAVTLDGTDQVQTGATTAWLAKDARGSGAGWNVTISSGNFSSAGGSIAVANFKCQLLQGNIVTVAGNTAPTTAIGTFVPLSGTPTRLLAAAINAGMGQYSYTPDFQLTVPGSTPAGSYTANVSVSVNSGP